MSIQTSNCLSLSAASISVGVFVNGSDHWQSITIDILAKKNMY